MADIQKFEFDTHISGGIPFEIAAIESKEVLIQRGQQPRRDTFFILFWITGGAGTYFIDFQQYPITSGMLFCVTPGQVHYWQATSPIMGTVILFMPDFLVTSPSVRFPQDFSLFDWNTPSGYRLPLEVRPRLNTLLQLLTDEYAHANTFQRLAAIQNVLYLLLIHMQRTVAPVSTSPPRSGEVLLHAFMALVDTHYVTHRKVQGYAYMLGVTPGHLSDTVSQLSGQTAIGVIHQRTALEAKRMLIHTEQTVSQIATALAFDDPSYFGRFFKRLTGETPHQFRQKFR